MVGTYSAKPSLESSTVAHAVSSTALMPSQRAQAVPTGSDGVVRAGWVTLVTRSVNQ